LPKVPGLGTFEDDLVEICRRKEAHAAGDGKDDEQAAWPPMALPMATGRRVRQVRRKVILLGFIL